MHANKRVLIIVSILFLFIICCSSEGEMDEPGQLNSKKIKLQKLKEIVLEENDRL